MDITFPSGSGDYTAYEPPAGSGSTPIPEGFAEATPTGNGSGLVLVCHENRGLTDHIRDVARRLAKVGYVACAIDLLSPEGGTAAISDPNAIPNILTGGDINRHVQAFMDAVTFYQQEGDPSPSVSGWSASASAAALPGAPQPRRPGSRQPSRTTVRHHHSIRFRISKPPFSASIPDDPGDFANEGRDDLEAALKAAGITYQIKVYPGTQHAFNNDTGPRYNEQQAIAAWNDTLAWFAQYLV